MIELFANGISMRMLHDRITKIIFWHEALQVTEGICLLIKIVEVTCTQIRH